MHKLKKKKNIVKIRVQKVTLLLSIQKCLATNLTFYFNDIYAWVKRFYPSLFISVQREKVRIKQNIVELDLRLLHFTRVFGVKCWSNLIWFILKLFFLRLFFEANVESAFVLREKLPLCQIQKTVNFYAL